MYPDEENSQIIVKLEQLKSLVSKSQYDLFVNLLANKHIYPSKAVLYENKCNDKLKCIEILETVLRLLSRYSSFDLRQAELLFSSIITDGASIDSLITVLEKRNLFADKEFMDNLFKSKDHFTVLFNLVHMTKDSDYIWEKGGRGRGYMGFKKYTAIQAINDALSLLLPHHNLPVLGELLTLLRSKESHHLFKINMNGIDLDSFNTLIKALCEQPSPIELLKTINILLKIKKTLTNLKLTEWCLFELCASKQLSRLIPSLVYLSETSFLKGDERYILIEHYPNIVFPLLFKNKNPEQAVKRIEWMSCTIPIDCLEQFKEHSVIEKLIIISIENHHNQKTKALLVALIGLHQVDTGAIEFINQSPLQIALLSLFEDLKHQEFMTYPSYAENYKYNRLYGKTKTQPLKQYDSEDLLYYFFTNHCKSECIKQYADLIGKIYGLPIAKPNNWFLISQLQLLDLGIEDKVIHQMICDHLSKSYQQSFSAEEKRKAIAPLKYCSLSGGFYEEKADPYKIKRQEQKKIHAQIASIGLLQNTKLLDTDLGLIYVVYLLNSPKPDQWARELIELHNSGDTLYWKEWFACISHINYDISPAKMHSMFNILAINQLLIADYFKLIMSNRNAECVLVALVRLKENNTLSTYSNASEYYRTVCAVIDNPMLFTNNLIAIINQSTIDLSRSEIRTFIVTSPAPEYLTQCVLIISNHNLNWLEIKALIRDCDDLKGLATVLMVIDSKKLWEDELYAAHLDQIIEIKDKMGFALYLDKYPNVLVAENDKYEHLIQDMQLKFENDTNISWVI